MGAPIASKHGANGCAAWDADTAAVRAGTRQRVGAVLALLWIGAALLVGCGGHGQSPQPDEAWENRSGEAWEAYVAGYRAAWTQGCEREKAGLIADAIAGSDAGNIVVPTIDCGPLRKR